MENNFSFHSFNQSKEETLKENEIKPQNPQLLIKKITHNSSKLIQIKKTEQISPPLRKSKSEILPSKSDINLNNSNLIKHEHNTILNQCDTNIIEEDEKIKEQKRIHDKKLADFAKQNNITFLKSNPEPFPNIENNIQIEYEKIPLHYTTNFTQSFTYILPDNYLPKKPLKLTTPVHFDSIAYSLLKQKLNTDIIPSILKNINKNKLEKALSQSEDLLFYLTQIIPIETNNI